MAALTGTDRLQRRLTVVSERWFEAAFEWCCFRPGRAWDAKASMSRRPGNGALGRVAWDVSVRHSPSEYAADT